MKHFGVQQLPNNICIEFFFGKPINRGQKVKLINVRRTRRETHYTTNWSRDRDWDQQLLPERVETCQ